MKIYGYHQSSFGILFSKAQWYIIILSCCYTLSASLFANNDEEAFQYESKGLYELEEKETITSITLLGAVFANLYEEFFDTLNSFKVSIVSYWWRCFSLSTIFEFLLLHFIIKLVMSFYQQNNIRFTGINRSYLNIQVNFKFKNAFKESWQTFKTKENIRYLARLFVYYAIWNFFKYFVELTIINLCTYNIKPNFMLDFLLIAEKTFFLWYFIFIPQNSQTFLQGIFIITLVLCFHYCFFGNQEKRKEKGVLLDKTIEEQACEWPNWVVIFTQYFLKSFFIYFVLYLFALVLEASLTKKLWCKITSNDEKLKPINNLHSLNLKQSFLLNAHWPIFSQKANLTSVNILLLALIVNYVTYYLINNILVSVFVYFLTQEASDSTIFLDRIEASLASYLPAFEN